MSQRYDAIEKQFGITAYASPNIPGFAAVLKGRFSDFCVREGMLYYYVLQYLFYVIMLFKLLYYVDNHEYNSTKTWVLCAF